MKTALIVTDMQNGFMNKHTKPLIVRIKKLLENELFDHVIFTRFVNLPNSPYVQLIGYARLQQPPETNIIQELQHYAKTVFTKHYYTPFTPEFENFLKKGNITHLYFIGVDTNACVQMGSVDAFSKGYIPSVLVYYCASHNGSELHEFGLRNLEKLIGRRQIIRGEIEYLPVQHPKQRI